MGRKDIAFRDQESDIGKEAFKQAEVHTFDDVGRFVAEELPERCPLQDNSYLRASRELILPNAIRAFTNKHGMVVS